MKKSLINKHNIKIKPDPGRVICNFLNFPKKRRSQEIIDHVFSLSEPETAVELARVNSEYAHRHPYFEELLLNNFERIKQLLPSRIKLTPTRRLFLGACFSCEYTFESAAQMNPSIVEFNTDDPVQSGSQHFILSLRGVGEGHISSLHFRTGFIDHNSKIFLDDVKKTAVTPQIIERPKSDSEPLIVTFKSDSHISERTIFPLTQDEQNGIEDARFVRFEDGTYYATYTAYDGSSINIKFISTSDFQTFQFYKLRGAAVCNKGMALFPRKIGGKYVMTSRPDGANMYITYSDNLFEWNEAQRIQVDRLPWEFIQTGNCGSPIETKHGWLLMMHGVGPLRTYVISAFLLDLDDPSRVICRLKRPLLKAQDKERHGYVPNVVYSCGSHLFGDLLVVPYAMSDQVSTIASIHIDELINEMS